jgi:hypothetical protein
VTKDNTEKKFSLQETLTDKSARVARFFLFGAKYRYKKESAREGTLFGNLATLEIFRCQSGWTDVGA